MPTIAERTWITDASNNRCSVEYWGSEDLARSALATMKNCEDCSDCSGCSDCSDCSGCSRCSRCLRCSRCSDLANARPVEGSPADAITIPVIPNIHQAVLAAVENPDALDMSTWHTCETTHCRAGWVVHLAGEAGKRLEAFHHDNTEIAAMLIYRESSPNLRVAPHQFYANDVDAMADIRRMAELERTAAVA